MQIDEAKLAEVIAKWARKEVSEMYLLEPLHPSSAARLVSAIMAASSSQSPQSNPSSHSPSGSSSAKISRKARAQ